MAEHDEAFSGLAKGLADNEEKIVAELIECQGEPVDIGGYFQPDPAKCEVAMRPSKTFNDLIDN